MIDPEERLWAGGGSLLARGPYTWHITDFDQRRHFSVTYSPLAPVQDVEETEDICLTKLRKHLDDLDADVLGVRFSDPDGPITVSTDEKDDVTWYVNCHSLSALKLPFPAKTIGIESLTELDRLGPQVDLVTYGGDPTGQWSRKHKGGLQILVYCQRNVSEMVRASMLVSIAPGPSAHRPV